MLRLIDKDRHMAHLTLAENLDNYLLKIVNLHTATVRIAVRRWTMQNTERRSLMGKLEVEINGEHYECDELQELPPCDISRDMMDAFNDNLTRQFNNAFLSAEQKGKNNRIRRQAMTVRELINFLLCYPMDAKVKALFRFKGDVFREYEAEIGGKAMYGDEVELLFDGTGKGRLITKNGFQDIKMR